MQAGLVVILSFFVGHWMLSVFCQTFFLHRYGAHRMFSMRKGWERFFHLLTYVSQGASYLNPRAYAILHREHHAYSDTAKDPHSPTNHSNVASMMWHTKGRYQAYVRGLEKPEARFDGGTPEWPLLDRFAMTRFSSLLWIGAYTAFYAAFATAWWMWLLLPLHFVMGPIHGAIVNWCGHRYGYRNYASSDRSKNSLAIDFLTLGELFQNNHHTFGQSPNFAVRWFELDPTYQIMRLLAWIGVIDLGKRPQMARFPLVPASSTTSPPS